ncbi:MAG: hypothetical protein ACRDRV_16975 [Pseudonocardiaceae bacterium]
MLEQRFTAVEQDRPDHHVQLVDQAGAQVLLDPRRYCWIVAAPQVYSSLPQGPRTGPNMLRPMMVAPRPAAPRASKSSR